MPKYKITGIVDTTAMDIDHLVDGGDTSAVEEFLRYDDASPPLSELRNMTLVRVED